MYNDETYKLGSNRSAIRELFEYGKIYAKTHGADALFDFSIGNPSIPTPARIDETIIDLIKNSPSLSVHGYTSAQGDISTRTAIANNINRRFGVGISADGIYVTCGAAASLSITIKALTETPDDEIIVFAPFFPEYDVFIKAGGAKTVCVAPDENFLPDFDDFNKKLSKNTRAVIVNSPNNPSGVVYGEKIINKICDIINRHNEKYGKTVTIISDEPYREIVYDGIEVPYIMNYYDNSVVCYSFSKSLSLPGERIGYIAVNPKCAEERKLYYSVCGAGRALGYICAPSLMQAVLARCIDEKTDASAYKENRDLLCGVLDNAGYEYVKPDGAFYLFVKSPETDANAFSERAKNYGLLLVPSDSFGVKGYLRVAYCVPKDMILRSSDAFTKLKKSYE